MKNKQQPILIDPLLYAELGKSSSGVLHFSQLHRLRKLVESGNEEINYSLTFLKDELNRCCIEGEAKVAVKLQCNRCLQLYPYELKVTFCLYPVLETDIKQLPKQLEVVVMQNGLISVIDIIEDELLLSLPIVAKHSEDDLNCQALSIASVTEKELQQQENPFVVLKELGNFEGKK